MFVVSILPEFVPNQKKKFSYYKEIVSRHFYINRITFYFANRRFTYYTIYTEENSIANLNPEHKTIRIWEEKWWLGGGAEKSTKQRSIFAK